MGVGAGVGGLVGAGALGGTTAGVVKKDGGTTGQALEAGAVTGTFGGALGAGASTGIGGIIDTNKKINMLKNLRA